MLKVGRNVRFVKLCRVHVLSPFLRAKWAIFGFYLIIACIAIDVFRFLCSCSIRPIIQMRSIIVDLVSKTLFLALRECVCVRCVLRFGFVCWFSCCFSTRSMQFCCFSIQFCSLFVRFGSVCVCYVRLTRYGDCLLRRDCMWTQRVAYIVYKINIVAKWNLFSSCYNKI